MKRTLYYVTDPMCSWCWGFHPVISALHDELPPEIKIRYVMGGLAKDSDSPMPEEVVGYVQEAWRAVEQRTGAKFNWEFWNRCQPRRSTYPACRAVLAASSLRSGAGRLLFEAIQKAYYLEARNPSDSETLIALAEEITPPIERKAFKTAFQSKKTQEALANDLLLCQDLGASGFPGLILEENGTRRAISRGYADRATVWHELRLQ